jgi:ribonuclease HI
MPLASTCHLCGTSDDHIDHIYGQCALTVRARSRFGRLIQYDLSHDGMYLQSELEVAHLSFPATHIPQSVAVAIFNWAAYMRGRTHPWPRNDTFSDVQRETRRWLNARGIADLAFKVWLRHRQDTWHPPLLPPTARGAGNLEPRARNNFGAAGRRSQLQKRLASEEAARLVDEAKRAGHIIAFTDGSVLDNPDPAYGGAAALVIFPPTQHTTGLTVEAEVPLGAGVGNNFAETWATGVMLQIVLEARKQRPYMGVPVMHCTDSRNTAALVTCRAAPRAHICLAHTVRRMAQHLNADNPLDCNWVAGHADIPLNVQVDEAAKRAASRSRVHPEASVDTQRYLELGLFALPRHISRTRHLGGLPRQGVG